MASKKRAPAAAKPTKATVKLETLEATPGRAFALLRGIGTSAAVRAALQIAGYGEGDHREGWKLLQDACGFFRKVDEPRVDTSVDDALRELVSWRESGLPVVRATLLRRFPAQGGPVLEGLAETAKLAGRRPIGATLEISLLLDHLDVLAASKSKVDRAAAALLGERGLDAATRKRLRSLVARAKSMPTTGMPSISDVEKQEREHLEALVALRGWYEEWSQIARATFTRRDHLIRLGLARRKRSDGASRPRRTPSTVSDP